MGSKNSRPLRKANTNDKGKAAATEQKETAAEIEARERRATQLAELDKAVTREVLEQTHFDQVEVSKLFEVFLSLTQNKPRKAFDKALFKQGLAKLHEAGLKNLDGSPFVDRLFSLLDVNNDGVVDFQEFITGLSLLCKGGPEEKLALCFKAYDLDGNGFITKDELAAMLKNAWVSGVKALNSTTVHEDLDMEELESLAKTTAAHWAENAFESLDTNGDGMLSFEEFKVFAMSQPKITATLQGFKKEVAITL